MYQWNILASTFIKDEQITSLSQTEMLNNMVASFTASNQIGEAMKKAANEKDANKKIE
jgi:hypothetical protein